MKNTDKLIACCGLDCEKCDARIATLADDNALREKTAALWSKLDSLCRIRGCVREKGLETCADCARADDCEKLGRITANDPSARENLRELRRAKRDEEEAAETAAGTTLLGLL